MKYKIHKRRPWRRQLWRAISWIERFYSLGYGWCECCGRPWARVEGHSTPYVECGGCFPLCKSCWSQLTPTARLPFYRALWEKWEQQGSETPWPVLFAACLHERSPLPVESIDAGMAIAKANPELWTGIHGIEGNYKLTPMLPSQVVKAWAEWEKEKSAENSP